jgi:hypothetical protein
VAGVFQVCHFETDSRATQEPPGVSVVSHRREAELRLSWRGNRTALSVQFQRAVGH